MIVRRTLVVASILTLAGGCGGGSYQETPPPEPARYPGEVEGSGEGEESTPERLLRNVARATYRVYVTNDSARDVSRVGFVPSRGAGVESTIPVVVGPGDVDRVRGIAVAPDGAHWYVSVAGGTPSGSVRQFAAGPDTLVGRAEVGGFPAALDLTADGSTLFVTDLDLRGDPEPSDISVVETTTMQEVTRVTACVQPRGSRIDEAGDHLYLVCEGSEQLVELDARSFQVTKRFSVAPGREGALPLTDTGEERPVETDADRFQVRPGLQSTCSPTWTEPATGTRAGRIVYVACNENDEVLAISTERWEVAERYDAGSGPHHMESTDDGRYLLVTLAGEQAVAVYDLDRGGEEVARIETSEPVPHGVVASPDSRYAFVTNEAQAPTRGTLDVLDLRSLERVATVGLGHRSGAIGFWEIDRLVR